MVGGIWSLDVVAVVAVVVDGNGQMHHGIAITGSHCLDEGEMECSIGLGCIFGLRTARYDGCC